MEDLSYAPRVQGRRLDIEEKEEEIKICLYFLRDGPEVESNWSS